MSSYALAVSERFSDQWNPSPPPISYSHPHTCHFVPHCIYPHTLHTSHASPLTHSPITATQLDIRLGGVNRDNPAMEGRVEVNYNSQGWGTICDDSWSLADADIACRMLGFKSALREVRRAQYGAGNGTIWFDDVYCLGNESSLLDCSHSGIRVHNCKHSEDAGVVCSRKCPVCL